MSTDALNPPPEAVARDEVAHRDAGLRRGIGTWGLAAITLNILMGAGFYVVPGEMARLGPWAPWGMMACGLVIGAVLLCIAEGASRVPTSGGIYGIVEAAFGRVAGVTIGGLTWLMVTFAGSAVLAASVDQAARLLPALANPGWRAGFVLVAAACFAAIAAGGARESARTMQALVVLKLVPLLLFLGVAMTAEPVADAAASAAQAGDIGKALILGLFLFMGAETALAVGGEVERPARAIPRGVLGAMAVYALFGAGIQWAVWHLAGASVIGSTAPLADVLARTAPPLVPVVIAGAIVATLGCVASMIVCAPRILFAYARDGLLPSGLGSLGSRQTPARAIWVNAGIIAALTLSGGYVALAALATLAGIGIYIGGCLGALALRRRNIALAGPPLRLSVTPIAGWFGMAAMLGIATTATTRELLLTLAAVAGLVAFALLRRPSA